MKINNVTLVSHLVALLGNVGATAGIATAVPSEANNITAVGAIIAVVQILAGVIAHLHINKSVDNVAEVISDAQWLNMIRGQSAQPATETPSVDQTVTTSQN